MSHLSILLILGFILVVLTLFLYQKGWVKPVEQKPSNHPPIFWISTTVVVMIGIISLICWMGW